MKHLSILIAVVFLASCANENNSSSNVVNPEKNGLTLLTTSNPEWQYENLRLYPVVAEATLSNASGQNLKTLAEAMKTPGFRVLERKQFGRSQDVWYHGVTVQNKTQDTVLIMSGDVVTGGNQDRVMAYHDIVLPGTVKNVEVYCVEAGRSNYYDQTASEAEKNVGAFKGYYNVASPQVRHAVQTKRDQGEVWSAVARITEANGATSSTKTYAALDVENEQKSKRDAYLRFFEGKLTDQSNIVGVVAVCGDQVLSVDIFANAGLFQRQFPALLHGYVAEAAVAKPVSNLDENAVKTVFTGVARQASPTAQPAEEVGKYSVAGKWVHLYKR
ncbi:MAG: hypothetical protein JNJ57_19795 [Saprospiraceae bacterium]|nr:hypothetical protein [Saprospiraceae bacterium]